MAPARRRSRRFAAPTVLWRVNPLLDSAADHPIHSVLPSADPDRCWRELGISKSDIRAAVEKLRVWPGTNFRRTGCIERMRGVVNAYKHENLNDLTLPIASDRDVPVGLGYGLEASALASQAEWKSLSGTRLGSNGSSSVMRP